MRKTVHLAVSGSASILFLLLAACGGGGNDGRAANSLDRNLAAAANEADPALTSALEDQIMVDPTLAAQSNAKSVRPAGGPAQGPIPPTDEPGGAAPAAGREGLLRTPPPTPAGQNQTLGDLARTQSRSTPSAADNGCDKNFRYSLSWAERLPAGIPLYPDARVTEAAGNDDPRCRMRIVSFTTRAQLNAVMDWYYTRARRSGFSAEHQLIDGDHVLAGTKSEAAYYITFKPAGGGTEVDIIANHGR